MALKATVYRAELAVADIDRGYYETHTLTLARHPSETEERLMIRLLAFAMHADPRLEFGRGLSNDDEPDLWQKEDNGEIRLWIDVGLPDERRLRRAAGRARSLKLLTYGQRAADIWWRKNEGALARLPTLTVQQLPDEAAKGLAELAGRAMKLQVTVQDGQISVSDAKRYVVVEPIRLM
jgi:uncharacterized protein YaeQ